MLDFKFEGKDVVALIEDFNPIPVAQKLIKDQVIHMTAHGLDADGNSFVPYTPRYARRRERNGLQRSPVDLRVTGALLTSIEAYTDGQEHSIRPSSEQMAKASGLSRTRQFLGVNENTIAEIESGLVEEFERMFS